MNQNETHTYHYLSVEESIRQNGYRHLERAISYASAGYPDRFYEGSMRKALKNFKNADALKLDPFTEAIFKPLMDMLARQIEDAIMNGTK